MARWTTSKPHPTKINLFLKDETLWVAKHGDKEATAPMRVLHDSLCQPGVDMGKFDALETLCTAHPGLWDAGYVILDY